jgi:two-component system, LytTR family, response regulator
MRVTTLIADDEPIARAGLRRLLSAVDWIEFVGEADNGPATRVAIDALRPELLFLDIKMPGILGIDALRLASHRPHVVFTTAYLEYAVTAFELGALDYLLKPFGPERFNAALNRARSALGEPAAPPAFDRMNDVFGSAPMTRLFVRSGRTITPIAVAEVSRFDADGDYVMAHTDRGRHLLHVAISRLERRLDPATFVRVHRAHIVNLARVMSFKSDARGQLFAHFADGARVPVSRARAQDLRSLGR